MTNIISLSSLKDFSPGVYLFSSADPVATEKAISTLINAGLFGFSNPQFAQWNQTYSESVFFWGPEVASYFFLDNVFDELASGLRLSGEKNHEVIDKYVGQLLQEVGLSEFKKTSHIISPWQLSGGQQQRLLVAIILSRFSRYVIGLNPLMYVDHRGRKELYSLVAKYLIKNSGVLLIASQEPGLPDYFFSQRVTYDQGLFLVQPFEYAYSASKREHAEDSFDSQSATNKRIYEETYSPPILEVVSARFKYPSGAIGVEIHNTAFYAGNVYIACGPNGGGKSSFLRLLISNHKISLRANLKYRGCQVKNPFKELVKKQKLAFTFQDPNVHIVGGTVDDYLKNIQNHVALANSLKLTDYLDEDLLSSPLWVRQATIFARTISTDADIFILDEPLDGIAYAIFGHAALKLLQDKAQDGAVIIVITHNPDLAKRAATKYLWVSDHIMHDLSVTSDPELLNSLREWLTV